MYVPVNTCTCRCLCRDVCVMIHKCVCMHRAPNRITLGIALDLIRHRYILLKRDATLTHQIHQPVCSDKICTNASAHKHLHARYNPLVFGCVNNNSIQVHVHSADVSTIAYRSPKHHIGRRLIVLLLLQVVQHSTHVCNHLYRSS